MGLEGYGVKHTIALFFKQAYYFSYSLAILAEIPIGSRRREFVAMAGFVTEKAPIALESFQRSKDDQVF